MDREHTRVQEENKTEASKVWWVQLDGLDNAGGPVGRRWGQPDEDGMARRRWERTLTNSVPVLRGQRGLGRELWCPWGAGGMLVVRGLVARREQGGARHGGKVGHSMVARSLHVTVCGVVCLDVGVAKKTHGWGQDACA